MRKPKQPKKKKIKHFKNYWNEVKIRKAQHEVEDATRNQIERNVTEKERKMTLQCLFIPFVLFVVHPGVLRGVCADNREIVFFVEREHGEMRRVIRYERRKLFPLVPVKLFCSTKCPILPFLFLLILFCLFVFPPSFVIFVWAVCVVCWLRRVFISLYRKKKPNKTNNIYWVFIASPRIELFNWMQ